MDISVVIPAYNAGKTIRRALESVCSQTFPPEEIIVVDDGSSDNTSSIVSELAKLHPTIRCIRQENAGLAGARNTGVLASKNPWIAFLDSDDWWHADKLQAQMASYRQNPADLIYTAMHIYYCNGAYKLEGVNPTAGELESLRFRNSITPSTVLVRRDVLIEAGLFDVELRAAEDWDLWVRLAIMGIKFQALDLPLVYYIESNTSLSLSSRQMQQELLVLQKGLVLHGLTGSKRKSSKRKILAAIYLRAALVDRVRNDRVGEMLKIIRSMWMWPFPNFMKIRYKTFAVSALRLAQLR